MVSHNYYVVVPQPNPLAYAAQIYQAAPVTVAAAPAAAAASKKAPSAKSTKSTKSSSKKADPEDDGPKVSPPPPPPAPAAPSAPASSEATLVEEPKKDMNEPPGLRPGMNYMFPAEHTKLHIFNKSSKVWEDKHTGKSL
jgi:hypothetical protein